MNAVLLLQFKILVILPMEPNSDNTSVDYMHSCRSHNFCMVTSTLLTFVTFLLLAHLFVWFVIPLFLTLRCIVPPTTIIFEFNGFAYLRCTNLTVGTAFVDLCDLLHHLSPFLLNLNCDFFLDGAMHCHVCFFLFLLALANDVYFVCLQTV